jgi:hypothetical protein
MRTLCGKAEASVMQDTPLIYQIRVQTHLDEAWSIWFEGFTITREEDGTTLLTGQVVDQAALHGILERIRDLGVPLLSVMQVT